MEEELTQRVACNQNSFSLLLMRYCYKNKNNHNNNYYYYYCYYLLLLLLLLLLTTTTTTTTATNVIAISSSKVETLCRLETSVIIYQSTGLNTPEDLINYVGS
jgi:hypothetical protein